MLTRSTIDSIRERGIGARLDGRPRPPSGGADSDEMWPSVWMAKRLMGRLDQAGNPHPRTLIEIEGDHAAVTRQFDQVEAFLQAQMSSRPGCASG